MVNRAVVSMPTVFSFIAALLILLSAPVVHAADMQISQLVDSPDPAIRGGEITYTLSVLNGANDTASDVVVTLPLPATTLFSSVNNGACSHDGGTPGTVSCNLGNITGDGSGSPVTEIDIVLRSSATTGSIISVTGDVTTSSIDSNPANNSLGQTTTINDGADLQVSITDLADPVISGANVDYALTVQNLGPNDAGITTVVNTLPTNVTYLSASGPGWSCGNTGQDVICTTASILNGVAAPVINISGSIGAVTGTITSSVTVSSVTGEPVPNNNTTTEDTTVTVSADLTITKSVSTPLIGGGNVTFTLAPRNLGFFSAATVVVSDPLPAGVAFISANSTGWSCLHSGEPTGGTVTCSRASYNVSASDDITIQATLPASGSLVNTATISAATADPDAGNNSGSANIDITPDGADLSVTKSKTPTLIVQGDTMTSTLQVTNNGPRATSGILTVTDTLAIGETYSGFSGTDWSCTHSGVNPGGVVSCTYASTPLVDGGVTSNLMISTVANSLGVLSNSATAVDVGGEVDGNPANDGDSAASTSTVPVDLSITKTASTADFNTSLADAENTISYTLTVTNNSSDAANNITVTDVVAGYITGPPTTAVVISAMPAGFSCTTGATVTCNSGANFLAGGASAVFIIDVSRPITNNAVLLNTATVSSSAFADPNSSNNSASATVNVSTQPSDLSVTKTATTLNANTTLEIGENAITYTITVDNNGPGPVTGVIVSDTIPGYVTGATTVNVITIPAGFSCSSGATVTCNNGNNTLINGASATFVIEVTRPLFDGSLVNTATVTSADIADPTPANNSDTANITVDPVFDVEMQSKIVTPTTVQAGVNATYVLTVRNNGPSSAANVAVADVFTPPGGRSFSKISATPSQGSCSGWTGDTLNCTIGTLVNGQSETITVVVRPDWDALNTQWVLPNTATVTYNTSGTTADSDSGNESQSASLTIDPAEIDILVNKTELVDPIAFDPVLPVNSDLLIYRVDISNGGPSIATGLSLSDLLTPKNGKQITFLCDDAGSTNCTVGNSLCNNTNTNATGPATLTMSCPLPDMAAGTSATRYLFFRIDTAPDASGDTHFNLATISANEIDSVTGNNSEGENTSVRAMVDLTVSQSADTDPVQLRQPFNWTVIVSNNGPGTAEQSLLSNTLPAGVELTGPPFTTQGNCTGSAGDTSFSCSLGSINSGANATVTVPVRVVSYPASGSVTNTATASTFGVDSNPANDAGSATVVVQRSSLAGSVYDDVNDNGDRDGGENGINAIQLQLNGVDIYNNVVSLTTNSAPDGSYSFTNLSPSNGSGYTLSQPTQPAGYFDGQENSGGTVVPGSKATDSIPAIAVASNSALSGYLFGELSATSISGFVWHDANNDGTRDVSETSGVAGVVMTLTGNDDLGAPVNTTVTTAADGSYTFSGLRPGTYTLSEGSVAGHLPGRAQTGSGANVAGTADNVPTSATFGNQISGIALQSGDSASGYNFGELLAASLSGTAFNDNNVNGTQESQEPGVAGVTLTLSGSDDLGQSVNLTTTTDANGDYSFTNLRPSNGGGYTITETQPTNYSGTNSVAGSLGGVSGSNLISGIPVGSNNSGSGYSFAEQSAGIAGYAYVDYDNNGNFDGGEAALSGVTINLTGTQSATTTTDVNGYYLFSGLPVGSYNVTGIQPAGWAEGIISVGSAGGTIGSNQVSGIALSTTSIAADYNFGERGNASVDGFVWHDVNNNGIRDGAESSGISGIVITLTGLDDFGAAVSETTTTAADGSYSFSNLRPGNYTLNEGSVTGYLAGLAQVGSGAMVAGTADNTPTSPTYGNQISGITVQNGDSASDYSFGELLTTSLSGSVFNDNNGNGNQESGEPGIVGVTVTLSGTDDLNQAVNQTTTTAVDGSYSFINLRPSNGAGYTLSETQPAGYSDAADSVGSLGGTLANDVISAIPVASDDSGSGYNFSEQSAGISGYIFADYNSDGNFDSGEPALPGVVITLSGSGQSATATTDANGYYIITGLPSGTYTITESQPAAWVPGIISVGSEGGTVGSNQISGITLPATTIGSDYNFAELGNASLSGTVFNDNSGDGNQGAGEPGIAGVTLTLSGTDVVGQTVNRTVITATDGTYSFTEVRPADGAGYTISETTPLGYTDALDTIGSLGGTLGNDILSAIPVSGNDNGSGYNFSELSAGISGYAYVDANNNGIFDVGEAPVPGVGISLAGVGQNATATTDANGYYIITGLPAGTYSVTESQPAAWAEGITSAGSMGGTVGINQISNITLGATAIATDYNFAEQGGSLSGFVYNDLSRDGINNTFESGVAAVNIALSGIDIDGNVISIMVVTAADGSYRFSDLPQPNGSGYTITESQPAGWDDGLDALGTLGGTLANDTFSNILFPLPGTDGSGYNFAEMASGTADISGTIWLDTNHDRLNNDGGSGVAGWRVELILRSDPLDNTGFTQIATTTSGANGDYQFSGLVPGAGYEVRFLHPSSGLVYGTPLSSEAGVDLGYGTIRGLTLVAGSNILDQSLPLDPAGVVYDSLDRTPIEGAVVSVTGPAGFDAAIHLVGGVANVSQTTATDGFYQFLFLTTAPAGTYTLSVVEPTGYLPGGSVLIPECSNVLAVTALPDPALVHSAATAPAQAAPVHDPAACPVSSGVLAASAGSTQYYLSFDLIPGVSGDVVNNHIPLDLITDGAFSVIKTTPKVNVSIGDLVPYTIRVTNNLAAALTNIIDVEDQLPPGFKYISGSARLDGMALEPQPNGRTLLWSNLTFTPNQIREFKLVLVVGAGVSEGQYINQAWSENNLIGQAISNIATASVRVVPDPVFDCTDIIGKIYDDANLNGYPDAGEEPLPGVRVVTARGWLVTSDEYGRYHIACAAVPNSLRGSNFILKVDERTLPSGYRITTENPRVIRLTRGKVARANFGATIHRVVRLDVANDAFRKDEAELAVDFIAHVDELLPLLKQKVSVLRINYLADFETEALAEKRLASIKSLLTERWQALDCCYNLIIEEELYWRTGKPRTPPSSPLPTSSVLQEPAAVRP